MLASSSPQRRALLAELGEPFEVVAADVDETPPAGPLRDAVRTIARRKAVAVAARGVVGTLLAADTVIDLDGELLGKPSDGADATRMLVRLSGRAHAVHTGVALLHTSASRTLGVDGVATSTVHFRALAAAEIAAYVATGEPFGKSGSYAIQGGAARFMTRLDGDLDNVVGLPLGLVRLLAATLASRLRAG
ncbi:MAG: septum formation protein Maf [Planctomycetes bacterium]|nr:septum formation protein Maf [Planctomycetota bacterium]